MFDENDNSHRLSINYSPIIRPLQPPHPCILNINNLIQVFTPSKQNKTDQNLLNSRDISPMHDSINQVDPMLLGNYQDRGGDFLGPCLMYGQPFLPSEHHFYQENQDAIGTYGQQEHLMKEMNVCLSPRPANVRMPQSAGNVSEFDEENVTPILYKNERMFQSNTSKRVLFSPMYF